ncbi:alkaline phosphatase family protein, partial [Actinomycetota bacterium]
FIDRYKDKIPELKKLLKESFFSPAFPSPTTETATNWTTIATGAWQGTHGITSFHAHLPGMEVNKTVHTLNSELCQAEYFWQAAERQGKRTILINYPVAYPINFENGIVIGGDGLASEQWSVRWPDYISSYKLPSENTEEDQDVSVFGEIRSETKIIMRSPDGWKNVPAGFKSIKESTIEFIESEHFNWGALGIVISEDQKVSKEKRIEKRYILIFEDNGVLKLLLSREKDFEKAITIIAKGQWSGWVKEEFFGKKCMRQYRIIDLSNDGEKVKIYGTMGASLEGWGYPEGIESEIIENCGPYIEALELTPDQALHHNWFGSEICLEIMKIQADWMEKCVKYLSQNKEWDSIFLQYHGPDGMNHMLFNGFWSEDKDFYNYTDSFMLGVYKVLFKMVDNIRKNCADENTTVCVVSDHGTLPVKKYVNANSIMRREGWSKFIKNSDTELWDLDIKNSKAAFAHWNSGIWINLKDREKHGLIEKGSEYERLRDKIINRLREVLDPDTGEPVFDLVARKEALEVLGLWGERIPDIMAFARSNYMFMGGRTENISKDLMDLYDLDEDVINSEIAFEAGVVRPIYSQHANLPCATEEGLTSMRAVFFLTGPDIIENNRGQRVNLVDVAATLSHILKIKPPKNCEGRIIRESFKQHKLLYDA